MAKLSDIRLGLATVIPWSLVLILGTLKVSELSRAPFVPSHAELSVEGSDGEVVDKPDKEVVTVAKIEVVKEKFSQITDEEDKVLIYKLFSGASEYLKNAKKLENTSQFDPILGRVQSSYGWAREKYPDFTDAVSEFLIESGYDEPRKLDSDEDRLWFQAIFESLAGATKI